MISRTTLIAAACTLLLFSAAPTDAAAQLFGRKKAKTATVPADTTAKKKPTKYDEFVKGDHQSAEGLITLRLIKGKLYFELPAELLGRDMLLGSTVTEISDNRNAAVGSKPTDPLHVRFTLADDKVQLRQVHHQYVSPDENIRRSLERNLIGAVLNSSKIECWNNDSTAVVFEMTDFFLSDNKKLTPFSPYGVFASYKRTDSFKKESSYISGIKSFGDNVSIRSSLTYTVNISSSSTGRSVLKDEPFTVEMTRSLVLLPESHARPRAADYRIGVFWSELSALGDGAYTTAPVYYAHRWGVLPSDTTAYLAGEKVAPSRQIVFYVDDTFPEWWKPYIIKEGIEQWNEVFEQIGFTDVIRAVEFPRDDPEFDPDNIKYSCVRYVPVNVQNAMGPSWVDPRSGEILNASVYVYHDVMKLVRNWLFVQTSPADEDVRTPEMPREIAGDALRYVIAHEIGHCLGFMHNMAASSVVPVDSLRTPTYTQEYGTTASIMDYARFNYVAQPGDKARGVKMTPPRFGEYDRWLVRWNYTPVIEAETFEDEAEITAGWITEAIKDPVYRYGKQQMSTTLDPRAQSEDLGDDAVKATRYGVSNLKYILANYNDWLPGGDEDGTFRRDILDNILSQMTRYIGHVYANVGGLYVNQVKSADRTPHIEDIPRERQVEALNYLFDLYGDLDWLEDRDFLSRMPVIGSPAERVRQLLANRILNTQFKVALYSDNGGGFTFRECADMVYDFVWGPNQKGRRPDAGQMYLQKKYVEGMTEIGKLRSPGDRRSLMGFAETAHPAGCGCWSHHDPVEFEDDPYGEVSGFEWAPRSIFTASRATEADCYAYLKKVQRLLKSRTAGASADVRAHYEHLLMLIDYALK